MNKANLQSTTWVLYLLECKNGAWYSGITNDLEKRFDAHCSGKGARYTRANPPVRILAHAPFPDRAAASRAEYQIKKLPKAKKLAFLAMPTGPTGSSKKSIIQI